MRLKTSFSKERPVSSGRCWGRVRAESQQTEKSPTPPAGPGQTLERPTATPRHSSLMRKPGEQMQTPALQEWASTFGGEMAPVA